MKSPEVPSVVAFDAYDTLAIWRPEAGSLAVEHGYTMAEVLAGSADLALAADRGEITYAQYGVFMEQRWGFTGYVDRIAQGFAAIDAMHQLAHDFYEAGSMLVIASNVGSGALELTFEQAALPDRQIFHHIFESCNIGHAKPHPEFFKHLLSETGIEPADHLFIDDSNANVEAAREFGMQAVLVDPHDVESTAQAIRTLYLPDTLVA